MSEYGFGNKAPMPKGVTPEVTTAKRSMGEGPKSVPPAVGKGKPDQGEYKGGTHKGTCYTHDRKSYQ